MAGRAAQLEWLRRLNAEYGNIRTALEAPPRSSGGGSRATHRPAALAGQGGVGRVGTPPHRFGDVRQTRRTASVSVREEATMVVQRELRYTRRRAIRAALAATAVALVAVVASAVTLVVTRTDAVASEAVCVPGTLTLVPSTTYTPFADPLFGESNGAEPAMLAVTADIGVDSGAEVRLAWALNGQPPKEAAFGGPANFANHTEFMETRTSWTAFGVSSATKVQPFVRLSGPPGTTATLIHRCFMVEASLD
jgi:hypothetical protein